MSEWYYIVDGTTKQGPVSSAELRALVQAGMLQSDAKVWKAGMTAWVHAWRLKGLFDGVGEGTTSAIDNEKFEATEAISSSSEARGDVLASPGMSDATPEQKADGRLSKPSRRRPPSDYGVLRFVGATVASFGYSLLWLAILLSVLLALVAISNPSIRFLATADGIVPLLILATLIATSVRFALPRVAAWSSPWFGFALQTCLGIGFAAAVLRAASANGPPLPDPLRLQLLLWCAGLGLLPIIVGVVGILIVGLGEFLQGAADVASNSWS